jgi:hypothetical protein
MDVAISSSGTQPGNLCVLLGNGDGTLQSPSYFPVGTSNGRLGSQLSVHQSIHRLLAARNPTV